MCNIGCDRDENNHVAWNKIKPGLLHAKKLILYPRVHWGTIEKCKVWE